MPMQAIFSDDVFQDTEVCIEILSFSVRDFEVCYACIRRINIFGRKLKR